MCYRNENYNYDDYMAEVKKWHADVQRKIKEMDEDWMNRKLIRRAEEIANGYMTK